jgi:DNA-directed RNA polymerase specialized sigma24 family protein
LGDLEELLRGRTQEWDASQTGDDQVRRLMAQGHYRAALEAVVRGYQHLIVRHCTAMLGDAAHGEEMAQEVFLGAYAAMPRFRQEASIRTDEDPELLRQRVRRSLDRLGPAERTVLLLRYETGLTLVEVAHIVGRSEASVRRQLARALEQLRTALEEGRDP